MEQTVGLSLGQGRFGEFVGAFWDTPQSSKADHSAGAFIFPSDAMEIRNPTWITISQNLSLPAVEALRKGFCLLLPEIV
jgi:hypothetical protein